MEEEQILVIDRSVFNARQGSFQGFIPNCFPKLHRFFESELAYFHPRSKAEVNQEMKQILPYVMVTCQGKVLTYSRGKKGGEKRLADKLSIGVGGHVNNTDLSPKNPLLIVEGEKETCDYADFTVGIFRELVEELCDPDNPNPFISHRTLVFHGLLNDDSNPVGVVHLGAVYRVEIFPEDISLILNNGELNGVEFLTPVEIYHSKEIFDSLENWSKLLVTSLVFDN